MKNIKKIIDNFSEKFHAENHGHRVASPLGAWMLLAYVAVEHPNPSATMLDALGCSTAEAKEILDTLMHDIPEVIASTIAAWVSPVNESYPSVQQWMRAAQGTGEVTVKTPEQDELDAWAKEHSLGLIEKFPLDISPDKFVALFATLLATKIDWKVAFDTSQNPDMKHWEQETFLMEPDTSENSAGFYEDETGLYVIHQATNADESLSVYSVMSVDPQTPEEDVMGVARKAVETDISNVSYHALSSTESRSLIVEEIRTTKTRDEVLTFLPAWRTENRYEIGTSETLGFGDAAQRFNDFDMVMEAVQVAVAQYNRTGFEAAALSTMMIGVRSVPPVYDRKQVRVNYNHPYAVVAVAHTGSWKNLPVFDGWISEAVEVK